MRTKILYMLHAVASVIAVVMYPDSLSGALAMGFGFSICIETVAGLVNWGEESMNVWHKVIIALIVLVVLCIESLETLI